MKAPDVSIMHPVVEPDVVLPAIKGEKLALEALHDFFGVCKSLDDHDPKPLHFLRIVVFKGPRSADCNDGAFLCALGRLVAAGSVLMSEQDRAYYFRLPREVA